MTVFYAAVHDPLLVFQKYDLPFYRQLILSLVCIGGREWTACGHRACVCACISACTCVSASVHLLYAFTYGEHGDNECV